MTAAVESTNSLAVQANALCAACAQITVTDARTYAEAGEYLKSLKELRKQITDFTGPNKKRWSDGHKEACRQENELLKPIDHANSVIGTRMGAWQAEQDRIRRAEEERIRKEEQARLDAETVEKAHELEAAGLTKAADVVMDSFPVAPPVRIEREKVDGIVTRTTWDYRIVDKSKIPAMYWTLNESMIRATVSAQKDRTDIPGVEAYPVSKSHARL